MTMIHTSEPALINPSADRELSGVSIFLPIEDSIQFQTKERSDAFSDLANCNKHGKEKLTEPF